MIELVKAMLVAALNAATEVLLSVLAVLDAGLYWLNKSMEGWIRKHQKVFGNQAGVAATGTLETIVIVIVLVYVGFMLVGQFSNLLGNMTSPTNSTVASFFTLGEWLIPVLAIVGLFLYGIRHFMGGMSGGGGGGGTRKRRRSK